MSSAPQLRRIPPARPEGRWPQGGRVRLGEAVEQRRDDGSVFERPRAVDYLRVVADESGITSPAAAAAFHEAFGAEPRSIPIMLPADDPAAFLGANYVAYRGTKGRARLMRNCLGPESSDPEPMDARSDLGWVRGPCSCRERQLERDDPSHCAFRWQLRFVIPDIQPAGVWDLVSSSIIGWQNTSASLAFLERATEGHLAGLLCELRVRMVSVAPGNSSAKLVPVVVLQAPVSVRELAGGGGRLLGAEVRELPPIDAEDDADELLDHEGLAEARQLEAAKRSDGELVEAVLAATRELTPSERSTLARACVAKRIAPDAAAIAEQWGDQAASVLGLREIISVQEFDEGYGQQGPAGGETAAGQERLA